MSPGTPAEEVDFFTLIGVSYFDGLFANEFVLVISEFPVIPFVGASIRGLQITLREIYQVVAFIDSEESGKGTRHHWGGHGDGRQRIGGKGGIARDSLFVEFPRHGSIDVDVAGGNRLQGHPDIVERRGIDVIHVGAVFDGQSGELAGDVVAIAVFDGELADGQLVPQCAFGQFSAIERAFELGKVEFAGKLTERTVLLLEQPPEFPRTVRLGHRGRIDIFHDTVGFRIGQRHRDSGRLSFVRDVAGCKGNILLRIIFFRILVHHGNLVARLESLHAILGKGARRIFVIPADGCCQRYHIV